MGLFSKLFSGSSRSEPPAIDPFDGPPPAWRTRPALGPHGFVRVVGESQYQETLLGLHTLFETIGREDRNFAVTLQPEPHNQFDSNAVAVQTESGSTIGYLERDVAETYQRIISTQQKRVRCWARLVGGADEAPNIGVVLDFEPIAILKQTSPNTNK